MAARRVGFALDIDGPLRRANRVIPRAKAALQALQSAGVPWLCLTNGGGEPEADKAAALSELLDFHIPPERMVLSHTPMRPLMQQYADKRVLVIGCGAVKEVAWSYGAKHVITPDEIAASDPTIYQFKKWEHKSLSPSLEELPVGAVFILHDATDWAVETQVIIDAKLYSGQTDVPIFASNPDIVFAGGHAHPRLAGGTFPAALAEVWRHVTGQPGLDIKWFGKPTTATFDFAQRQLEQQAGGPLDRIFMVGDNLAGDIRGANKAGDPWRSVLISTGIWHPGDDVDWARREVQGTACAVGQRPHWGADAPWAAVDDVMSAVTLGLHETDAERW